MSYLGKLIINRDWGEVQEAQEQSIELSNIGTLLLCKDLDGTEFLEFRRFGDQKTHRLYRRTYWIGKFEKGGPDGLWSEYRTTGELINKATFSRGRLESTTNKFIQRPKDD